MIMRKKSTRTLSDDETHLFLQKLEEIGKTSKDVLEQDCIGPSALEKMLQALEDVRKVGIEFLTKVARQYR